ncbi:sigma factor-like helix-turn-helix DNA-binding protein [Kribbella sp. NPDC051952]|uniref:sigma factor-like helix-turn-helix DNA-binding protein n=1 Tax=Kribbella sp. NPDC051952 TaxID=3154851 RepID=UPI00341293D6
MNLHRSSDAELIRLHGISDPNALGVLLRRHQDRMWTVAIRILGEHDEAAAALQDAFASIVRRTPRSCADADVIIWLHKTVVDACLARITRRQARERRSDILEALQHLAPEQRIALVLVDMQGYSPEQAATILGCTPITVRHRCARGRARLLPLLPARAKR